MADYDKGAPDDPWSPVHETVRQCYERRKDASKHQADWRSDAREDFEFREGEHWSSDDRAKLEEQGRPVVTFNRVAPIISSVAGHEINNRQEIRYLPRTLDDRRGNEIYTEAARWVRDGCDAEDEESDAYSDALVCGMGWLGTHVDYDEEPEGRIVHERCSPLDFRWDPAARKRNILDANWLIREKRWRIKEVEDRWPDKAGDISPSPRDIDDDWWIEEHDASRAWQYREDHGWENERDREATVLVLHYQWREREPYWRVGDVESGRVLEFSESKFSKIRDYVEAKGLTHVRLRRWVYRQAFIAGDTLLEEGPSPIEAFSYRCITGMRDERHGLWYGLMRAMKDPQRWANKFFSQTMHIFNANAKGGVLAEETAVEDWREFEERWASADGVVKVADGVLAGGRLKERTLGGYPTALDKLLHFAISSIRDCTGINLEILGMADRDQPGVLEMERKRAALVTLAPLLNALRRYRYQHARDLLQWMHRYVPEGTIMRVTGEQAVPFYRDQEFVKYDVVVDTAPSSPNLKQEVWSTLGQMLPSMVKVGIPIPPDLIDFSPLPESVAARWKAYIEERSGGVPPEIQEQMNKLQEDRDRLEVENNQLKTRQQQHMAQIQQKREEHQLDMQIQREEMLLKAQQAEMEATLKKQISQAELGVKLEEIRTRYELEMQKIREQGEQERERGDREMANERLQQILQIDADLAKEGAKRVEFETREVAPHLERLQRVEALIKDESEADEARRRLIMDYLDKKGGEVGGLVSKLRQLH